MRPHSTRRWHRVPSLRRRSIHTTSNAPRNLENRVNQTAGFYCGAYSFRRLDRISTGKMFGGEILRGDLVLGWRGTKDPQFGGQVEKCELKPLYFRLIPIKCF